jgi:hypothetical protein
MTSEIKTIIWLKLKEVLSCSYGLINLFSKKQKVRFMQESRFRLYK